MAGRSEQHAQISSSVVPYFPPKIILCAIDLSSMSGTVLEWARLFAAAYDARLHIVHVEWTEYPPYILPSQEREFAEKSEKHLLSVSQQLASIVRDTLGEQLSPATAVLNGRPAEAILEHVASLKPDLLVIGSHGHSGFSRLRLGSVADEMIRANVTPVLIVRTNATSRTSKISRVLCPVSFSENARRCLQVSAQIAANFHAQLIVMHAIEHPNADLDASRRDLCKWVPSEMRKQCAIMEVVKHGNAAEQIVLAAKEQSAELIVIGAAHERFLDLALMSATAERVIRHAETAVLALPWKDENLP